MKLACIGPLSPSRTGVADFTENLLPYLAKNCEIKLCTDGYVPSATPILSRFSSCDISEFIAEPSAFDAVLYHMGNHYRYHKRVFEALWKIPGVVMLHDCVINQFFGKYCLERGNFGMFRKLFELCYPNSGDAELPLFYKAKGDPYCFPMAGVVAGRSRGTIVMSEYGRGIVLKEAPRASVAKINFPYFPALRIPESARALRRKFNVPQTCLVVTSIGHMTRAKRIHVALEAFRKFNENFPDSLFLLAGEASRNLPLATMIRGGSLKNVRYLGYLDRVEVDELMEMADVCINLRYPSNGEMSSTLINMLGRGKAVVVSNYAQFAEFPDSTCVKLDIGPNEIDDLADKLLALALDEDRRISIGDAARNHMTKEHSPDDAAETILKFIEEQARAGPSLSDGELSDLFSPDDLLRRCLQKLEYRMRRLFVYVNEQGIGQTLKQILRHAS